MQENTTTNDKTPYPTQVHRHVKFNPKDPEYMDGPEPTTDLEVANVATSEVKGTNPAGWGYERHKLLVDIDMPCKLIPSSTPGHHHLFIDKEMSRDQMMTILRALSAADVVESGYVDASDKRGYTAVRLPWIKKNDLLEE